MSRSDAEEKVNQGHRKSYSRMKNARHQMRQRLKKEATLKEAKNDRTY